MSEISTPTDIKTSTNFTLKPIPKSAVLPPLENAAALLKNPNQVEPEEIVEGLIHRGTKVVLGGSSKAGKTSLLMYLALCVTTGNPFLRWATHMGGVLYINFEILAAFMKSRLETLIQHMGISAPSNLDVWNLRGFAGDFDALMAEIVRKTAGENYALIILDPIYKVMRGKSENAAAGVGALCLKLERLAERTGAAVVYAHHFTKGKQTQKKPIDRLSGSGVFGRDADSIVLFTDHNEPNCFSVDVILRNLPPQESFVTEWKYPVMVEREDLEPEGNDGQDDARTRLLLTLLLTRPLTTGEWEAESVLQGIPGSTFLRRIKKLEGSGHVVKNPQTKTWSVAPELVSQVSPVSRVAPEQVQTTES